MSLPEMQIPPAGRNDDREGIEIRLNVWIVDRESGFLVAALLGMTIRENGTLINHNSKPIWCEGMLGSFLIRPLRLLGNLDGVSLHVETLEEMCPLAVLLDLAHGHRLREQVLARLFEL
jgi:hypothetical protein